MVTIPTSNPNLYESSEGFSLQIVFPYRLIYREFDREMFIFVEPLAGEEPFAVYLESMSNWQPPYHSESITNEDRMRIGENIRKIFDIPDVKLMLSNVMVKSMRNAHGALFGETR